MIDIQSDQSKGRRSISIKTLVHQSLLRNDRKDYGRSHIYRSKREHYLSWSLFIPAICSVFILIAFTAYCAYFYYWYNGQAKNLDGVRFQELNNYEKRELANLQLQHPIFSIDFTNGFIILSQEYKNESKLCFEKFSFNESSDEDRLNSIRLPDHMSNCYQILINMFCCNREFGPAKGTHCYFTEEGKFASHIFAKSFEMTKFWQSILNEGTLLIVKSNNKYHVIDTSSASIYDLKDRGGHGRFVPLSYFFSMESSEELSELAKMDDTYVICQYLKDNNQHYRLAGDEHGSICSKTRIMPMKDTTGVKFCANPIYQAVIHYDDSEFEKNKSKTRWHLQVAYNDAIEKSVYQLEIIENHSMGQMAMNCEPTRIEVYVVAEMNLLKYDIFLPRKDAPSLLENDK